MQKGVILFIFAQETAPFMKLPSRYLQDAVDQLSTLPSIGKRSALRLVLSLLHRKPEEIERFANSFTNMKVSDKEIFCIFSHILCIQRIIIVKGSNLFHYFLFIVYCKNCSISKPYASTNSSGIRSKAASNGLVKNKLGLIPFFKIPPAIK